jgi:ribosomal peptide maturation radical SAM protein 1
MGEELLSRFTFVDAACQGEADESFPALLGNLDRGDTSPVPGVVHRLGGAPVAAPAVAVHDLDALPVPDFSTYFEALDHHASGLGVPPRLLLETARGCWWGAHTHCTFCGLNGSSMAFRSKSPARALDELRTLYARYDVPVVSVVDNILDMRYVRTLLPELEREGPHLDLFWEVKANLSQAQVRQLAAAGVRHVQPGIESMSDHVLELLRKGTTMVRNLQLLKWGAEHGVRIEWNLLFGVPGETPDDYAAMADLFELIPHLDPPGACGPIRLDRFSPYHADPASFGMVDVRPMVPYRYLYDVPDAALARIAYYFDFAHADRRDPLHFVAPALAAVGRWQQRHGSGGLWAVERPDGELAVIDERPGRPRRSSRLAGWKAAAFRALDRAHSADELATLPELDGLDRSELDAFLRRALAVGVAVNDGERFLALAVHAPARAEPVRAGRSLALIAAHA